MFQVGIGNSSRARQANLERSELFRFKNVKCMGKEAYYFSHDSNAKDDPKCVQLIEDLGLEGYGIYWVLVETLRDQPNYRYPIRLIPSIARRYNTTTPKVKAVVEIYGLFVLENEEFFSLSLNKRMAEKEAKSLKAKESANHRWKQLQSGGNANALTTHNEGNAIKERKGKETKEKKRNKDTNVSGVEVDFEKFVKYWNSESEKTKAKADEKGKTGKGIVSIQELTDARKTGIKILVRDFTQEKVTIALKNMFANPFFWGFGSRGWRAGIDFFIQRSSFVKLLENSYDWEEFDDKTVLTIKEKAPNSHI